MKIAIVCSNNISIKNDAKKGTEIFFDILIKNLAKHQKEENMQLTAFVSGDSRLSVPTESISFLASSLDKAIPDKKHIIFELALLSKAFSQQDDFDLYHINIGDGDIALPFANFVKKPILITIHNTSHAKYLKRYFSLFKDLTNVFFISISDAQRKSFPNLNFIDTIYHGVDTTSNFTFNPTGGDCIIWAGRAIPKKGMDVVLQIAQKLQRDVKLFPLMKEDHYLWFQEQEVKIVNYATSKAAIYLEKDIDRLKLAPQYQSSKLFLFPIKWEEPFGLVAIESMACGTPVVAYARGSMPEVIKDGVTGFLVNPSKNSIRGNWIIKKTGVEGLAEAVERIYAMSDKKYSTMRLACRTHVEDNFAVERMIANYIQTYKRLTHES